MTDQKSFETWAIVEVMGHRQYAGYVTEQAIGGTSFVRVDVPEVFAERQVGTRSGLSQEVMPAFTKLLGAGSIYAISPCTEETARAFASRLQTRSFSVYEAPRLPAPQAEPEGKYCVDCGCELVSSVSMSVGLCRDCSVDEDGDDLA
jgi:hypothetical protein